MPSPVDLRVPYGATTRGFHRKNIFADQLRLLGQASRTVVDVGAHHGEEVATYLAMFPEATIHAIEPTPASVDILRKTWGHDARVHVHGCALAEREGEATLHTYTASECNALTPYAPADGTNSLEAGSAQVRVPVSTLDRLCTTQGIDRIDLLKLDTQGAELRVLAGADTLLKESRIGLIALEVLFVPLYEKQANPEAVMALLRDAGYRVYDWYNFSYDENGQVLFGDAMFVPSQAVARGLPPVQPLADPGGASDEGERAENERLRASITHLEGRIDRYRSKLKDLRQRTHRGKSET